jgi:ribosome assembly protein 3
LPSFLPSNQGGAKSEEEQKLKDRFRQFWMASVADGFKDDLEEIRKVRPSVLLLQFNSNIFAQEPNLGPSRLALLIDSLASGADVFNSSSNNTGTNEMDVVLN